MYEIRCWLWPRGRVVLTASPRGATYIHLLHRLCHDHADKRCRILLLKYFRIGGCVLFFHFVSPLKLETEKGHVYFQQRSIDAHATASSLFFQRNRIGTATKSEWVRQLKRTNWHLIHQQQYQLIHRNLVKRWKQMTYTEDTSSVLDKHKVRGYSWQLLAPRNWGAQLFPLANYGNSFSFVKCKMI